jgi:hypothetical protein
MAEAKRRGYGEDGIYFDHRGDCRDSAHHKTCSGRGRGVVSLGFDAGGRLLACDTPRSGRDGAFGCVAGRGWCGDCSPGRHRIRVHSCGRLRRPSTSPAEPDEGGPGDQGPYPRPRRDAPSAVRGFDGLRGGARSAEPSRASTEAEPRLVIAALYRSVKGRGKPRSAVPTYAALSCDLPRSRRLCRCSGLRRLSWGGSDGQRQDSVGTHVEEPAVVT